MLGSCCRIDSLFDISDHQLRSQGLDKNEEENEETFRKMREKLPSKWKKLREFSYLDFCPSRSERLATALVIPHIPIT